jgi:hypothetical protein
MLGVELVYALLVHEPAEDAGSIRQVDMLPQRTRVACTDRRIPKPTMVRRKIPTRMS